MSLGRGVGSELTFELDNWARPVETSVNERHIFWAGGLLLDAMANSKDGSKANPASVAGEEQLKMA